MQVYTTSGSTISASVNPEACATGQTSTSISTDYGKTVTFADKASSRYFSDSVLMKQISIQVRIHIFDAF